MRNKWTKFNNVLMYISMVADFIAVISFSYLGRQFWWAVVLLGAIGVLVVHAVWGMLIEMSKNIIKLGSEKNTESALDNDKKEWVCPVCMKPNASIKRGNNHEQSITIFWWQKRLSDIICCINGHIHS